MKNKFLFRSMRREDKERRKKAEKKTKKEEGLMATTVSFITLARALEQKQ